MTKSTSTSSSGRRLEAPRRFFLDPLATHILALEGDSHVEWFEGNFEAYEEDKRRRLGDEADRPHRMTYRKLTR